MRIEQLEYLAAVTQHGSLRRASERLHISQPALSEAVSKLERELGVVLLDRRRSGARISREGRELLQHMVEVLEAVDRLKVAAGDRGAEARRVRVGTVNAATTTLLVPAIARLQQELPQASLELTTLQQHEIDQGLLEGSFDLGLINVLSGDDPPVDLVGTDLLHGRPVVVLPAGHPLSAQQMVSVDDLRRERFVAMRAGYLMHRFAHRIFGPDLPTTVHSTDGAEMGKTLVAEGLGLTLLPDYSVEGDPMERAGLITTRPIAGDQTIVTLVVRQRASAGPPAPLQVRALHAALLAQARTYAGSRAS
ncbi:LysR family transcriptional regulator [Nocardioides litoris]|uniref:LysR family transcriptional regulator n=1 Tax=Nocardioides litoris TaxID=1926648 RepID=UPI00111EBC83|nr:LysR family transcriptional regulator [Nocardioides litoris]